jgi:hypothetical protein
MVTVAARGLRPELSGAVVDRWWPHRVGEVVRRLKTRLHVRWLDGEVWRYDAAHARFLEPSRHRRGKARP